MADRSLARLALTAASLTLLLAGAAALGAAVRLAQLADRRPA